LWTLRRLPLPWLSPTHHPAASATSRLLSLHLLHLGRLLGFLLGNTLDYFE
jgi:hypothetical protein